MPSPFLRSSGRPRWDFYCSLCKIPLKSKMPRPAPPLTEHEKAVAQAKTALLKEWDEHLAEAHPQQWEREQRKRARRVRGEWDDDECNRDFSPTKNKGQVLKGFSDAPPDSAFPNLVFDFAMKQTPYLLQRGEWHKPEHNEKNRNDDV